MVRLCWATYWFGIRCAHGSSRARLGGTASGVTGWRVAMRATYDVEPTLRPARRLGERGDRGTAAGSFYVIRAPERLRRAEACTWSYAQATDWRNVWRDLHRVLRSPFRALVQLAGESGAQLLPPVRHLRTVLPDHRLSGSYPENTLRRLQNAGRTRPATAEITPSACPDGKAAHLSETLVTRG